jgi:hypothetical protein
MPHPTLDASSEKSSLAARPTGAPTWDKSIRRAYEDAPERDIGNEILAYTGQGPLEMLRPGLREEARNLWQDP